MPTATEDMRPHALALGRMPWPQAACLPAKPAHEGAEAMCHSAKQQAASKSIFFLGGASHAFAQPLLAQSASAAVVPLPRH